MLESPYERIICKRLNVFGTWWPGCEPGERLETFEVIIVSYFKRTPDSQAKLMFIVGLINDGDPARGERKTKIFGF